MFWLLAPFVTLLWVDGQWPEYGLTSPILLTGLLAFMMLALWQYEKSEPTGVAASWMSMMAGLLYLGWLGSHFFRLRALPDMAWQWTGLTVITIWIADSFAYVIGRRFGRHKLSPRLSPNKTVEGYVGGIVGGIISACVLAYLLNVNVVLAMGLALIISSIAPMGDLAISLLKRSAGVKDSGNLLPGHGGALDRTDSLVWSVALAFYFLSYVL
jgi:phosphatidate cytidylyltransferase